jgi:hypothetical protein
MLDKKFNLENDLKNSAYIKEKIKDDNYAQNLYAALICKWQPLDIESILVGEYWSTSWRGSGAVVARLRYCGESYMDYYCSGIAVDLRYPKYVAEETITDEIRNDLFKLGWKQLKD